MRDVILIVLFHNSINFVGIKWKKKVLLYLKYNENKNKNKNKKETTIPMP
jgi:hypothetical protein